jgi:putative DNA primase/helicase
MTSPVFLPVRAGNIPGELKALPQWVMWRGEPRNGRVSKIPYRIDGRRASSVNPDDWTSFEVALKTCQARGYSGVGFVFATGGGIVGVDLDHVISVDGDIEPWVLRAVEAFDSYTEYSVSGTGLHILCKGEIPGGKGRRREPVEIYDRGRFFTVSGRVFGEARPLREPQPVINRLLEWIKREEPKPQKATRRVSACPDDRKLLHRAASAKNGYKFARLWQGDASDYGGDDSRADMAMLSMLLFWTQGNEARADALFRQSGLNRDKWERRADYRERCFRYLRGA